MGWVFLSALANRWLWLMAVFATAVLLATGSVPVLLAVLSGAAVLGAGAAVDAASQVRRSRRRVGGGRPAGAGGRIANAEASAHLARARAASQRLDQGRGAIADVPGDVAGDVAIRAGQMLEAMHHTGRQVDRLDTMLAGVDPYALQAELGEVERALAAEPAASGDLTEQRQRTADGLRAQLAAHRRVSEQRTLMLAQMRATAVGIEGLAVRVGEIGALYEASGRVDTSDEELRGITSELEGLRDGLVDAERGVRAALSSTDLPGMPELPEPPPGR